MTDRLKHSWWLPLIALCIFVQGGAHALISPRFTPVHLVHDANDVLPVEVTAPVADRAAIKIAPTIKGTDSAVTSIDVADAENALLARFEQVFENRKTVSGIIFIGDFSASSDGFVDKQNAPAAMIQIGTEWFGLARKDEQSWTLRSDPYDLSRVWGGSASMLLEVCRYVLAVPNADVPAVAGTSFLPVTKLGHIAGNITGMQLVELAPGAERYAFIQSDAGDRLFILPADGGPLADNTVQLALASHSRVATWGDFTGDGRTDLLSWDGTRLSLQVRNEAGTFVTQPVDVALADCIALTFFKFKAGKAGALAATSKGLQLLTYDDAGHFSARRIGAEIPSYSLVADVDNDGNADIVQIVASGVNVYRGNGTAEFAASVQSDLSGLPATVVTVLCSDFDSDGRLDLIAVGAKGPRLLRNTADGKFNNIQADTGELDYHSRNKPAVVAATLGDFNHDSRPDVTLFYAEGMGPLSFFNRGFGCFGLAREIALNFINELPAGIDAVADGQRAGAWVDMNGDGGEDLLVVAPNGDLLALNTRPEDLPLSLRIALPVDAGTPFTVTVHDGKRNLGARLITSAQPAFFYKRDKGPLDLSWVTPDGKQQSRRVNLLKSQRIELREP